MTDRYVSNTATNGYVVGNDSNDGLGKSTPLLTLGAALASASDNDVIYVNAGTYTEVIYSTKRLDWYADGGIVVVENTTSAHLWRSEGSSDFTKFHGDWTLDQRSGGSFAALRPGSTGHDIQIIDGILTLKGTGYGLTVDSSWTGDFTDSSGIVRFENISGRPIDMTSASAGNLNLSNVLILDCDINVRVSAATGNINIQNLLIGGYGVNPALNLTSYTGVMTVTNLIEVAHGSTANEPFTGTTVSNFIVHNGFALPSSRTYLRDTFDAGADAGGAVVGASGNTAYSGVFATQRRAGSISLMLDDYGNIDDWDLMCDDANERGLKVSLTTESRPSPGATQSDFAVAQRNKLITRFAEGHDITSHGKTAFTSTISNAFDIQYTGTGTATMTVSGDTLTTSISGGGGETEFNIDLTGVVKMTDLVSTINGDANYTCTIYTSGAENASQLYPATLADVAAQNITSSAHTATLNLTKLYADEFGVCVSDLESYIPGLTVTTHVWSTGAHNANSQQGAFDNGLLGARAASAVEWNLENGVLAYATYAIKADAILNAAGDPRRFAVAFCEWVKWTGAIVNIYDHAFAISTTRSLWQDFMDACVSTDVNVETYSQQVARIRGYTESGSGGGLTYTETYDYSAWTPELAVNSPASFIGEWPYGQATSSSSYGIMQPIMASGY